MARPVGLVRMHFAGARRQRFVAETVRLDGMRATLLLLLVLVVLLTGLPFGMAMGDMCSACPPSSMTTALTVCVAIVSALMLIVVGPTGRRAAALARDTGVLIPLAFEHPPRA